MTLFRPTAIAACLAFPCLPVLAQDLSAPGSLGADMLPQGRSAVRLETRGSWADQQYGTNGERESLGADYDGLNLNNTVFPALPPGATLGVTHIQSRMVANQTRLTAGYGLAKDVTVGFQVGYGEVTNHVDATVSGGNLPLPPGVDSTTYTQNLLTTLYGYKPIQSSTWHSALDPMLGLRWRFERGDDHATVFAPTLRIGTAKQADPNDLMQMVLADGTTDLLFGVLHTRKLSDRWDLKLSAQYTVQLPDHVSARARSSNETIVPASRTERMRRDRTDPIELTSELGYGIGNWHFSGRLEYARGGRDRYTSPSGQDTSGLSANTDFHFLLGYLGVSWNGVPGYLRGEYRVPLLVSLVAATTLDAKNTTAPDSLYVTVTLPF
jgi:hypothetical protein